MKNLFFAAFVAMAMAGCTADEPLSEQNGTGQNQVQPTSGSTLRTIDEAIEIANEAASLFEAPTARSGRKVATGRSAVQVLGSHMSRSGSTTDTLLYIVNYADAQGFAIIAAPSNVDPLIGVTEQGEFASLETASNEGFQFYLDAATNYVINKTPTDSLKFIPITPGFTEETKHYQEVIQNKVKVKWGQVYPEGFFCPNKLSGCVQTAIVQVMSYLEEPKSVQLSYPDCDKNVESLNWASIKSHVQSSDLYMTDDINQHLGSCDASLDAHLSLARLCREIGHRNDAKYNTTSTSVTVNRLVFGTIQRFHLTEWLPNRTVSGFTKLVQYNSLFEGVKDGIVLLNGIDDSYGGHAWVADGAVKNGTITYITHTGEIDPSTGKELVSTRENLKTYFHFNWGWNGNNNGFFDAGVFAPQNQSKDPVVASLDLVPSSPYDFSDYVEYCVIK